MRRMIPLLFALCLFAPNAHAYDVPAIEAFFGASHIEATTGNGRLTAAVSPEGDLTVLSWPSPSYFDHLQWIASNADGVRDVPRAGALEGMGVYAGLAIEASDGSISTTWLNDTTDWETSVAYTADDSTVIETTFVESDRGITVVQTDVVDTERDVLQRDYTITVDQNADVADLWLLGYSNLSPSHTKLREMPIADFAFEQHQDFIAAWDADSEAIIHFHPADNGTMESPLGIARIVDNMRRDFGAIGDLLTSATIDESSLATLVSGLDDEYSPGVYVALGAVPAPDQYQVGYDGTDVCGQIDLLADNISALLDSGANPGFTIPSSVVSILKCGTFDPLDSPRDENGWLHDAQDARVDAADGELSGSRVAAAQVNTALRVPVNLTNGVGRATLLYAFEYTADGARVVLDDARDDIDVVQARVEASDAAWAADIEIPDDADEEYRSFLLRSMLSVRAGTDAESGAIVASISRQPSYHVDWPRDGVFFNVALDLAGKHELVEKRLQFYANVMRREPARATPIINTPPPGWPSDENADDFPPGSWEMNYYADGVRSGNIRLEIDNTALLVWNFVQHAGWIEDEDERRDYLMSVWDTVTFSADWLAGWRDPETGLIWPSNEDDHIEYTQGMQGNATTFLALEAAAMAATYLGEEDAAARYVERAQELHVAIMEHLWDAENERFIGQPPWSERTVTRPTEWIGWPVRLLDWDDERLRSVVREGVEHHVRNVRGETSRGQYPTKAAISAALMFPGEPEAELADEIARTLATEIATDGTKMLGEVFVNDDVDGDGEVDRRLNVQGNPHLWSQSLVYVTARALAAPEDFDRYREVLPAVSVRTEVTPDPMEPQPDAGMSADMGSMDATFDLDDAELRGSGCACTAAHPEPTGGLLLVIAGFMTVVIRRRRP